MKEIRGWNDVTIGQYQEIMSIETDLEISRFITTMSILLDKDSEEIRSMNIKDYKKLVAKTKFLSEEPKSIIKRKITIGNKSFGLIPDMTLMEAGVFIDADQFKSDPIKNLHLLVALIFRPIKSESEGGEYEIEEHRSEGFLKRAELFKESVKIEEVMGAVLFFSLIEMTLLSNLMDSLGEEMKGETLI